MCPIGPTSLVRFLSWLNSPRVDMSFFWFWTNYSLRVYMSFQSDTFDFDSEPTTLCGYICRSNRTHLFLILNQQLFAGIYFVPIGRICFWFWTNYSLRVYMSFQSDTLVSDSEPTTLCGYICRSNRTHLFLILNELLFAGIYVVPIGHICFWFWNNYSLRVYMYKCVRLEWHIYQQRVVVSESETHVSDWNDIYTRKE
jgi:hypothetical protein